MNSNKQIVWERFSDYWEHTDWGKLKSNVIEALIGDFISFPIPEKVNDPKIGTEFHRKVRDCIVGAPTPVFSPLEKKVFDMYRKNKIGTIENQYCVSCRIHKDLAGPISLFHIGSNFPKDKYKLLFVGKNTWYDAGDYYEDKLSDSEVCDARKFGQDCVLGRAGNRSQFIQRIRNVTLSLYGNLEKGAENISITNIIKCNTTGENSESDDITENYISQNCMNLGVVEKEIEVLNPKRIIFFTGRDYDHYIKRATFGFQYYIDGKDEIVDSKERPSQNIISWSRCLYNKDNNGIRFILRVSHPQGKDKAKFVGHILNWVAKTSEIENEFVNNRK